MVENWIEKYRPTRLADIEGNPKALTELEEWAVKWRDGTLSKKDKKALILYGKPGIGKTTAALALANEMGWSTVELNASDVRTGDAIRRIATLGAITESFTTDGKFISTKSGLRKLIILDEADNIFGKEDYGGLQAIVELIKFTNQPVVLIANDYYELVRRSGALKTLCDAIEFQSLRKEGVVAVLKKICQKEGIKADDEALLHIAERASNDLRAAINDLQSVCEGRRKIGLTDLESIGARDPRKTIFTALSEILKSMNLKDAKKALAELDEPPDRVILWLDENLPAEYRNVDDLRKGYEALAKSDIYLGRVKKSANYRLWAYASDLMSGGVAIAKRKPYGGTPPYQFPSWLKQMSRMKATRTILQSLLSKIAAKCRVSRKRCMRDILPYFKQVYMNDHEFRVYMTVVLEINGDEAAYLLDEKPDSHPVKHLLDEAEKLRAVLLSIQQRRTKTDKRIRKRESQRSLLQF